MGVPVRYAIYFTPDRDHPLTRLAASWLGRDAFSGAPLEPPSVDGLSAAEIAFHAAPARRYGFHATLKAPFELAPGLTEAQLIAAVDAFAGGRAPVALPKLKLARLDSFFALVPSIRSEELDAFAADVVREFDRFRAPLSETEIERRNPDRLSAPEFANLTRWGYPYVMESFRFHMTLTGRVAADQQARIADTLEALFGPLIATPVALDSVSLFAEPEAGAPFTVLSHRHLGRLEARKSA
jgi:putative phosphonate metabolism protein